VAGYGLEDQVLFATTNRPEMEPTHCQPTNYPVDTNGPFPGDNAAGASSFTSMPAVCTFMAYCLGTEETEKQNIKIKVAVLKKISRPT
jgi:hypothetical protein